MNEHVRAEARHPETLPAAWYSDPAFWPRERERIFRRQWQLFAREAELAGPGDYLAGDVAGWPILVRRGQDGRLHGFHNLCRHRAAMLVPDGKGCRKGIVCPYHSWSYHDDGRLRIAPSFVPGPDFDPAEFGLIPVSVDVWRGLVFVALEPAQSLADWIRPIDARSRRYPLEDMHFHRTVELEIPVNWKAFGDNYAEAYHVPAVHPGLMASLDLKSYRVHTHEAEAYQVHEAAKREGGLSDGLWVWKFPGLFLNMYDWGMNVARMEVPDPRRIRLVYWYFFTDMDPARKAWREEVFQWSVKIGQEDKDAIIGVQRNLDAGIYRTGRLSSLVENGVVQWQDWIRKELGKAA
jgi:choline monooxygenase